MVENPQRRPGFHDGAVRGLSITMLVLGVLCFGCGIAVLVIALTSTCRYRNYYDYDYDTHKGPEYRTGQCRYFVTWTSPGIWSGLMYLATGIVGVLAGKRKTTCMIVSMMVLSVITTGVAGLGVTYGIGSNFDMDDVNSYPIILRVGDSLIALCGVIAFIISWVQFGLACRAVCCSQNGCCPTSSELDHQYHPLHSQPIMCNGGQVMQGDPRLMQAASFPQHVGGSVYLNNGQLLMGAQQPGFQQVQQTPFGMQASSGTAAPVTQA